MVRDRPRSEAASERDVVSHEPRVRADQRQDALRQARETRALRAVLKRDLKEGRASVEDILGRPPEWLTAARVSEILLSLPGFGRVKVNRLLNLCRIAPSKTLGGLSERQRSELLSQLARHRASGGQRTSAEGPRLSPTRRSSQPREALEHARAVRTARAALKRRVAAGELGAAEVILTSPWEAAGMPISELLMSQRGWGRARVGRLLASVGVPANKSIRALTERQRSALSAVLAARRDVRTVIEDVAQQSGLTHRRAAGAILSLASETEAATSPERIQAFRDDRFAGRVESGIEAESSARPPAPSKEQLLQFERNAQARWELLSEAGFLPAKAIAETTRAEHDSHDTHDDQHGLLAVTYRGRTVYPGFQFDPRTGHIRGVVTRVVEALPTEAMSRWEAALWWTASNGWLAGARPIDLIDEEPDRIVRAAAMLAQPSPL
ncbi:MAG: hypothetical protein LC808_11530 [Actinobacteria bacterium]|nr:hypothetical protein [Actinomycetota bacterium]